MRTPMNDLPDNASTLVYGIHAVETLLGTRLEAIDHIYIDKDKRSAPLFNLMKICRKERLAYNLVPLIRLDQIAGNGNHQGIVAVCNVKPYCTPQELQLKIRDNSTPLLVLAASIEDPQNLGALIRSCVAFNVDALLLERKNTAPLSPAVAKASAGTVEHLTILRPKNLEGIVREYISSGFGLIGTHAGKGDPLSSIDLRGPSIILLGGEHRGIPPYLEKLCTRFARIAIDLRAQSLNVSATGAVVLYECSRQRTVTL
jgi:23S rRNA (guanosine2251-2'-O)-methyltransferase